MTVPAMGTGPVVSLDRDPAAANRGEGGAATMAVARPTHWIEYGAAGA